MCGVENTVVYRQNNAETHDMERLQMSKMVYSWKSFFKHERICKMHENTYENVLYCTVTRGKIHTLRIQKNSSSETFLNYHRLLVFFF